MKVIGNSETFKFIYHNDGYLLFAKIMIVKESRIHQVIKNS